MSFSLSNYIFQATLFGLIVFFLLASLSHPSEARRGASKITLRGTSELEAEFFNDLKDKRLQKWSLADAFFIASGIRDEVMLESARDWLTALVVEAKEVVSIYRSPHERADHLLRWLHKRVFKNYQARSTDAVEIMKFGRFNCLSSCIVYGMIGERLGLNIRGIAVDQHAFCRVYSDKKVMGSSSMKSRAGGWDVETTTALGFNPGRSLHIDRTVVSVPRSRYRNRREISLWEMIGLIYTNHIGMTRAYPSDEDKLLAYQKAALFFPRDEVIQHNILAASTQVIQSYASRRKWKTARTYLNQMSSFDLQDKYVSALWLQVAEQELDDASRGGLEEATKVLDDYRTSAGHLPASAWFYLEAQLLARAATHLHERGQEELSRKYYEQSCAMGGRAERQNLRSRSKSLVESVKRLRYNHLVLIKNVVIQLFNERIFDGALLAVKYAHKAYPHDPDILKLSREIKRINAEGLQPTPRTQTRRSNREVYGRRQRRR